MTTHPDGDQRLPEEHDRTLLWHGPPITPEDLTPIPAADDDEPDE